MFQRETMKRFLPLALAVCCMIGCGRQPSGQQNDSSETANVPATTMDVPLSPEVAELSKRWKAASLEERQILADVNKIGKIFLGASREEVRAAFGEADQSGIDMYGDDVLRYELGTIPDTEDAKAHLTFVFENDVVSNVMGNSFSF
jgi:hypothetical protein